MTVCLKVVLVNLTRKKTCLKNDIASLDVVLGDNFRYNFDYVENGYNLSLDSSRNSINSIVMWLQS
jgi:NTE family protein